MDEMTGHISGGSSIIEIDRSALLHNLEVIRRQAGDAAVMAVVKANAYGHGLRRIAGALRGEVDAFAVNDVGEGRALREAGIHLPVLVFGAPEPRNSALYRRWNLTATVSSLRHFHILEEGTRFHLNFDTGMGRLGLSPDRSGEVKQALHRHDELHCEGVYSHFATADRPGSDFARRQFDRFRELLEGLDLDLPAHMANTGGLFFYPASRLDMVRVGISLYGYAPGDEPIGGLRPVLAWKTHLVQVKRIGRGETVSYGANWTCPENGYVGVIPVGYEDGIRRNLSGRLSIGIGSARYPVVGTVTMNYCMVWLGGDRWPEFTEVTLLGEELDAALWARESGTIPYEILTGLPRGIPRRSKTQ